MIMLKNIIVVVSFNLQRKFNFYNNLRFIILLNLNYAIL